MNYSPSRNDPFSAAEYEDLFNNSVFFGYRAADLAYEISLYGKNLGDEATMTTGGVEQVDYNVFATGYAVGTPVRPREFGVVLTARF